VKPRLDPLTAAARERCRQLGIGDFDKHKAGKIKPPVVLEDMSDTDDAWLHQILEKRRAMMAAQRRRWRRGRNSRSRCNGAGSGRRVGTAFTPRWTTTEENRDAGPTHHSPHLPAGRHRKI
jgi:hypothetical protein